MLINICFGFIMLIASLIESPIAKTRMWQKRNTHLANFDVASLHVIWFRWGPLLGCPHIEMSRAESARCNSLLVWSYVGLIKPVPRSVVCDAHERIVRCSLGIIPASSETEDKFEGAMELTASLAFTTL